MHALASAGVEVQVGHDARHVRGVDVVLATSAAKEDHPEIRAARENNVPVLRRRELLPHLLAEREVIAVAGTHGKTTTTGMIVHLLRSSGKEIGYIVGAWLPRWGNAAAGRERRFVIEADEYDYMFWGIDPAIAVVTNVEWDHVDCFPAPEDYQEAFAGFVRRAKRAVIVCAESQPALAVAEKALVPVITFGLNTSADWTAQVMGTSARGGVRFQPVFQGTPLPVEVTLPVPGYHNVLNALAALAALVAGGEEPSEIVGHLNTYPGASRRFQVKGEINGILVIDDYAHHPTEVRATLAAARMAYPQRRVWAVFQPHTYSRTRAFLDAWRHAFAEADRVVVMDIYAAREQDDLGLSGPAVAAAIQHPHVLYGGAEETTVRLLAAHLAAGDVVITLGAGTSVRVAEALVERLRERRRG